MLQKVSIKSNRCPNWGQLYVEKVNNLSIYDYSNLHSFDSSVLSVTFLLVSTLRTYFLPCCITTPVALGMMITDGNILLCYVISEKSRHTFFIDRIQLQDSF